MALPLKKNFFSGFPNDYLEVQLLGIFNSIVEETVRNSLESNSGASAGTSNKRPCFTIQSCRAIIFKICFAEGKHV